MDQYMKRLRSYRRQIKGEKMILKWTECWEKKSDLWKKIKQLIWNKKDKRIFLFHSWIIKKKIKQKHKKLLILMVNKSWLKNKKNQWVREKNWNRKWKN